MRGLVVFAVLTAASQALANSEAIASSEQVPATAESEVRMKLAASEARVAELERIVREDAPKTKGLIPYILFGPKLSIINLPTPALGLEAKAFGRFGASFDYGLIPTVTVSDVSVHMTIWRIGAKVYPFRGSFLVGAGFGRYTFEGRSTVSDGNGASVPAKAIISSTFVEPQIGWRWVGPTGFFTAIDLGWKIPLNYSSTLNASVPVTGTVKDIKDKADQYAKSGIPALGLLQVGWFL